MKTTCLIAAISLALSVSAAQQQGTGSNVGSFGNNKGSSFGFGGSANGKNQNNNANNNGKNGNNGKNAGAGASSVAVAASSAAVAATSTAAAAANTGAAGNSADAQTSTTLDPAVIASGFANNGQDVPTAGQVASLTSTNNFINFCLTVPNLPITNGKQITTGSCNPAPMGSIPSTDNMPSAKFQIPKNGDSLPENTPFTITMAVANFETGNFVNAEENYFAAPQQLNSGGQIVGHSHVVVEQLSALDQTTPTDPKKFAFFKGLNAAAVNGVLTADVTAGLPAGFYKVSSINTAANHQPVLVPIAQHGSLDDVAYFTVTVAGGQAAPPPAASSAAAAAPAASSAAVVAAAPPAPAKGNTKAQQGGQRTVQQGKQQQQQGKQQQGKQQGKQQGRRHARAFF